MDGRKEGRRSVSTKIDIIHTPIHIYLYIHNTKLRNPGPSSLRSVFGESMGEWMDGRRWAF
jgi:hypothetical protein